jgi:hypothetical protein
MSGVLNKIGSRSGRIWAGQARAEASGGGGGASTFTAVADGAIAAGDECIVTSAGKLAKIASSTADVIFGPTNSGLFTDWSTGNGWKQHDIYSRCWDYAQTLSPNPFASLDAVKQAGYASFTNSSWGIYVHQDGSGGYGVMGQYRVITSNVYSDYYLYPHGGTYCINATGGAPFTGNLSSIFNWMNYKQLVFRFTHSATTSNMVDHNFVGWSTGAYADGANATVSLKGTIETNLNGLTIGSVYFIQMDGTVGTTAATTETLAGIALASDQLLVS